MLRNFCTNLSQNKNSLMLFTSGLYMLALYAVLYEKLLLVTTIVFVLFLVCILKDLFKTKYVIIWAIIYFVGILNTSVRLKDTDELLSIAPVNSTITGTVLSIPQGRAEGKPKFYLEADNINFSGISKPLKNEKVLVTLNLSENVEDKIKIYDYCELTGRLSTPFKVGNPSQFDYGNYLRNHDAYTVFYAKDYKILPKNLDFKARFLQGINNYREHILQIHSKYLPSPNLEILGGIVFGDDAVSPDKEIKQSFVNSGLLHILAASGMNVAFIYTFFYYLLGVFRLGYKLKVSLGIVTILLYLLMTGMGASIVRAATMLIFVLIGKLIDRDAHSISLLSFVALLMLLFNPLSLNDVGFQLSFIVTFGLLFTSPLIPKYGNKVLDFIAGSVAIPIIAQLWVIPVQIFYFNNISVYSVFANIMSVPILMVMSFGGFISSLISIISPIADFVCKIFDFVLNPLTTLLVNVSDFWGHLPNSTVQTTHPSVFQILLYYGMLMISITLFKKEYRDRFIKPLCTGFFSLLLVLGLTLIPIKNSDLVITAFDVGNADCFMIKTPDNQYIMIDTGKSGYKGGKSQAEFIILKYFKDKGIKNFNSIIVTHFDNDHCGGAVDLINALNVKKIYVNDLEHNSDAASKIYSTARKNNVEIIKSVDGEIVYEKENVLIKNFTSKVSDNDNDNSIITLLRYNDFSMLFTGDAGCDGIKSVIPELPQNITVLKVPHHGAMNSLDKDVMSYLNPRYAIISVGENKFGHPSRITLSLLENTRILRTDIDNSIRINVRPKEFNIYTYDFNSRKYKKLNKK